MEVHQEFTSRKFNLVFDGGKRIELSREESIEYEKWVLEREKQARKS